MFDTYEQILRVFTQSEKEQAAYFPRFQNPVWVEVGTFYKETMFARDVALLALNVFAMRASGDTRVEVAQLSTELVAMAYSMTETNYTFLVWHPDAVHGDRKVGEQCPIFELYAVWEVVRRLAREALAILAPRIPLVPFNQLFGKYIFPSLGR